MTDLELLHVQLASAFVLNGAGRIVCVNDPGRSTASLVQFAGCADGNVCLFRADVPDKIVQEIERVFATEPLLKPFGARPKHLARYLEILSRAESDVWCGLNWELPRDVAFANDARVVQSGTTEGDRLLERFAREGVPRELFDMGFKDTSEFWAPWCAVFAGDEIASLGFAARLGREGADLGLVTVPSFRGRGFGATATAAWAHHPALAGKALFYSTSQANLSSQRVVERLGLRYIGASCIGASCRIG